MSRAPRPFRSILLLLLSVLLCSVFVDARAEHPVAPSWSPTPVAETIAPRFLAVKQESAAGARYPTMVRDLRSWSTADGTRLVLDLNRKASFSEHHLHNPDRVVIEVQNAVLGKDSRRRVSGGTVPHPYQITQSKPRTVTITLPRSQMTQYKAFALANPDRLVIDVSRMAKEGARQVGEVSTTVPPAPAPAAALPTPPVIPSPTVTEPARPASPKPAPPIRTIVIDPGHGGKDPGTIGRHGTTEKDVTLKVGLMLKDLIGSLPNTRVLMTRDRDTFIELEDRAKFANEKNADLFLSIHVNSHPHKGIRGLEIYHFGEAKDQRALEVAARENGTPLNNTGVGWQYIVADLLTTKKIEHSQELAWTAKQAMVSNLNSRYSTIDHGVKTAPFYVLRFTTMPSILAEIAFMSNPTEEDQMRSQPFLTHIAEAIFDGVKTYLHTNPLR
ncbi:MAG: N-acetylmuramoyl-L-alanine amidase AmiC [Nitrospirae bacterium]|nr:MAG: putative n-acetylmuramoyl-L-alanine amidase AmiB [Nitrospira sp. OLB3]MBV6470205.1 N-acetylmuramoyl-L-alanine amidase AmiC [Nitrospirota bacterium]MCE7964237.1 N-acetylmuramoyl-L-alanine amidase [Nitrospira sp. NTP2]MCK6492686.1 N-acetylmuramoyl-L-alanine amidase [Nitrospira sp.]MEB2337243.1 N-acetylmuramoyl-L-alanine amidase [Nitrospirales bacterium]